MLSFCQNCDHNHVGYMCMQFPANLKVRNILIALFSLILVFGIHYKNSGTARLGGYTDLFDTALIGLGSIGVLAAFCWPRNS